MDQRKRYTATKCDTVDTVSTDQTRGHRSKRKGRGVQTHLLSHTTRPGFRGLARRAIHWTDQPAADHGEGGTRSHKIDVVSESTRSGRSTKSCSASDSGKNSRSPDNHLQSEPMHRILPRTYPLFNHSGTKKTRQRRLHDSQGLPPNSVTEHDRQNHGRCPCSQAELPGGGSPCPPEHSYWRPKIEVDRARTTSDHRENLQSVEHWSWTSR